mmetsp:Transcript_37773/g.91043  ORF Transcript_37773/g.91043 Transcript_37773/m.91043 type:complete len:158 (-) Transcript_37773:37-510(-)
MSRRDRPHDRRRGRRDGSGTGEEVRGGLARRAREAAAIGGTSSAIDIGPSRGGMDGGRVRDEQREGGSIDEPRGISLHEEKITLRSDERGPNRSLRGTLFNRVRIVFGVIYYSWRTKLSILHPNTQNNITIGQLADHGPSGLKELAQHPLDQAITSW